MITDRREEQIRNMAISIVSHWFALMINPKMRGDKFKWTKFPQMMYDECYNQLYIQTKWKENLKECQELCGQYGYCHAFKLVKLANLTRKVASLKPRP